MFTGVIAAAAHGACLPLLMLFFGNLINVFVYEEITSNVVQNFTTAFSSLNMTNITVGCDTIHPLLNINLTSSIREMNNEAMCILPDEFIRRIDTIVFIFLEIAGSVWIASYLQVGLLQASAERQVHKIRLAYYKSVLRQNIAWYDENPSGELASRVSE